MSQEGNKFVWWDVKLSSSFVNQDSHPDPRGEPKDQFRNASDSVDKKKQIDQTFGPSVTILIDLRLLSAFGGLFLVRFAVHAYKHNNIDAPGMVTGPACGATRC